MRHMYPDSAGVPAITHFIGNPASRIPKALNCRTRWAPEINPISSILQLVQPSRGLRTSEGWLLLMPANNSVNGISPTASIVKPSKLIVQPCKLSSSFMNSGIHADGKTQTRRVFLMVWSVLKGDERERRMLLDHAKMKSRQILLAEKCDAPRWRGAKGGCAP